MSCASSLANSNRSYYNNTARSSTKIHFIYRQYSNCPKGPTYIFSGWGKIPLHYEGFSCSNEQNFQDRIVGDPSWVSEIIQNNLSLGSYLVITGSESKMSSFALPPTAEAASALRFGNVNPIPFRGQVPPSRGASHSDLHLERAPFPGKQGDFPFPQNRLTCVQQQSDSPCPFQFQVGCSAPADTALGLQTTQTARCHSQPEDSPRPGKTVVTQHDQHPSSWRHPEKVERDLTGQSQLCPAAILRQPDRPSP